jgi:hypothetical protein
MAEATKRDRKLVEEFIIPKCSGKAFLLDKGQIMKVIAHEGPQVVDVKIFNAHDYREQFAAWESAGWNSIGGLGGGTKKITTLFSRRPWCNVMATVIDDPVGDHLFGPSCCEHAVKLWPELDPEGGKTCWDYYCEVLRPYGICEADIDPSGTFDVFMATRFLDDETGTFDILEPPVKKGDYIEIQADMDLLVAAISCPDRNQINSFKPKGSKVQIFE